MFDPREPVGTPTATGDGGGGIIPLSSALVETFAGVFLSPMYDSAAPTPAFHREVWDLYCGPSPFVAVAAPRGHAKSTAFTHTFGLAAALFRFESHILIVSATEELAMSHLGDIAKELRDSDDLREEFGLVGLTVDSKGEIVCRCNDGYEFRFIARGSGQKLRGIKWRGRRPGLILCDDMEEDEQVESKDRREKFGRWVNRALIPLGRIGVKIRWHGTILHVDAMLARLMKNGSWVSRLYKAHAGFDDFTQILWPEYFIEEELRRRRQTYIDDGDAGGYSQEYLNNPLDNAEAYIQRAWFIPFGDTDWDKPKIICAAADFAITKGDRRNRTSLTVGGKCAQNIVYFVDQRVGRWDSMEIVEELFSVADQWNPDIFWVETGAIWAAIWPVIRTEMTKRDRYINFVPRTPVKDKASRGRSLQKRMRAGATRWMIDAHWFPGMQDEILRFTGNSESALDDQFDSAALLSLGFEDMALLDEEDFVEEEELEMRAQDPRNFEGRSSVTGY
jgi:hypothetical protein